MLRLGAVLALCATLASVQAVVPADEVTSLPLFSGTVPPKSQYSGYLDITSPEGGKHMHYWLAKAQQDDGNAPVVFWFTGGPGCSSDAAFWTEQGTYHMATATGTPKVVENPWAWNKIAHVVFIDSPAGVGYSYADTPRGLVHNDTSSAEDNYQTLLAFFKSYPEFNTRDVWITGESYAGIYVPMLAQQIVKHGGINLKGIAVGNGCIGTEKGGCSEKESARIDWEFLSGNHLVSQDQFNAIKQACNNFQGAPSAACEAEQAKGYDSVGRLDIYDVYAPCTAFSETHKGGKPRFHAPPSSVERAILGDGPNECFDDNDTVTQYLNLPEVRAALHVKSESSIGKWAECTSKISYTSTMPDEPTLVYPDLVRAGLDITIYNGNFDLCVPVNGNEEWTSAFGTTTGGGLKEAWRPWTVDDQVQGYVTTYNGGSNGGAFRFVTVNAAGHMVPEFQPERAFRFFERALGNRPF